MDRWKELRTDIDTLATLAQGADLDDLNEIIDAATAVLGDIKALMNQRRSEREVEARQTRKERRDYIRRAFADAGFPHGVKLEQIRRPEWDDLATSEGTITDQMTEIRWAISTEVFNIWQTLGDAPPTKQTAVIEEYFAAERLPKEG